MGKSSKRKTSYIGTAGPSPTLSTENKAVASQSKADSHAPPPPLPPGTFPPPPPPPSTFPTPPPGTFPPLIPHQSYTSKEAGSNSVYFKIQTLPNTSHSFIHHDYMSKKEIYRCIKYYLILAHFNPETKDRPTHKQEKLIAAFMKYVYPLLEPYRSTPPVIPMQTHQNPARQDFNPLAKKNQETRTYGCYSGNESTCDYTKSSN